MTEMVISDVAEIKICIRIMNATDYTHTSIKALLILKVLPMPITLYNISNTKTITLISTDSRE